MNNPASQAVPDAPPIKVVHPKDSGAIWRALIWKEWCEHRWRLAALTAIGAVVLALLCWSARGIEESAGTGLSYTMIIGPLAALFVAMGAAAGEHAAGTIGLSGRLPTEGWRLSAAKLTMAFFTAFIPVALVVLVAPEVVVVLPFAVASLVLWFAVFGMNQSDEIRAAAFGLAGVVVAWGTFWLVGYQVSRFWVRSLEQPFRELEGVVLVASTALPGGILLVAPRGPANNTAWWWISLAYASTHGPLLWRWLSRYGAPTQRVARASPHHRSPAKWLGAPFASPTRAILWKQLRETVPVAFAAFALALAWTAMTLLLFDDGSLGPNLTVRRFAHAFTPLSGTCAFLAAVVAGVGLFLEDLRPGVSAFWRSRPIPPDRWFWLKYGGGLACLIAVFGGGQAIGLLVGWETGGLDLDRSYFAVYAQAALGFWVVYSCAACATCLVRQPIYAAILGVGFPCILYGLTATVLVKLRFSDATSVMTLSIVVGVAGVVATLTAWQAVRRDWALLR